MTCLLFGVVVIDGTRDGFGTMAKLVPRTSSRRDAPFLSVARQSKNGVRIVSMVGESQHS